MKLTYFYFTVLDIKTKLAKEMLKPEDVYEFYRHFKKSLDCEQFINDQKKNLIVSKVCLSKT